MSDWSRIVADTISDYVKGEEINVLRMRKLPALAKSKGRYSFNKEGRTQQRRVRFRRGTMQGFAISDTLTFPQVDRWKIAELPWRGYATGEGMSKYERLVNKGKAAIIEVFSQLPKIMLDDMADNFAEEFYLDGNATGNTKRFQGIETFLGAGVPQTRPFVADPSDTYAGLNTALNAYGGTWSGTWPNGRGSAEYDFWSPLLVNYTAPNVGGVGWSSTTKDWENVCLEALRFAIIQSQRSKANTGMLDLIMLDREMYRVFLERRAEKERFNVQMNSSNSLLVKNGFGDVQNFDGVDITWEYGTPSGVGYGFNMDQLEMQSLQGQLFVPEGPDFDPAGQTYRFWIDAYGNFWFNPRNFVKLASFPIA